MPYTQKNPYQNNNQNQDPYAKKDAYGGGSNPYGGGNPYQKKDRGQNGPTNLYPFYLILAAALGTFLAWKF